MVLGGARSGPGRWINVASAREAARRALPRAIFDFVDGGAEDEVTLRRNLVAFDEVVFDPANATSVGEVELQTSVLGDQVALPVVLAPCGMLRVLHPDGDIGAARAAEDAGTRFTLSTMSCHALEDVAAGAACQPWFQLYPTGGRAVAEATLVRARAAGYRTLLVTVDNPIVGPRHRDRRNGITELTHGKPRALARLGLQCARRPGWLVRLVRDGVALEFPNVVMADGSPLSLRTVGDVQETMAITWADFAWIRELWPGPIAAKGVLSVDDARRAVDAGLDGVVVSNHGGRQLDGGPATIEALPRVVSAIGEEVSVLIDGGIRRGSDVVKALCLGADAVMIGRPFVYGLAAAGTAGARAVLEILRQEMVATMTLLGCGRVDALGPSFITTGPRQAAVEAAQEVEPAWVS